MVRDFIIQMAALIMFLVPLCVTALVFPVRTGRGHTSALVEPASNTGTVTPGVPVTTMASSEGKLCAKCQETNNLKKGDEDRNLKSLQQELENLQRMFNKLLKKYEQLKLDACKIEPDTGVAQKSNTQTKSDANEEHNYYKDDTMWEEVNIYDVKDDTGPDATEDEESEGETTVTNKTTFKLFKKENYNISIISVIGGILFVLVILTCGCYTLYYICIYRKLRPGSEKSSSVICACTKSSKDVESMNRKVEFN